MESDSDINDDRYFDVFVEYATVHSEAEFLRFFRATQRSRLKLSSLRAASSSLLFNVFVAWGNQTLKLSIKSWISCWGAPIVARFPLNENAFGPLFITEE
jgi:hypothetical protein